MSPATLSSNTGPFFFLFYEGTVWTVSGEASGITVENKYVYTYTEICKARTPRFESK